MRILFIVKNFWPELTGVGLYAGELADWLHQRGHEVTVICAPPHYPSWQVAPAERVHFWRHDTRKPYSVLRCPTYIPAIVNTRSRLGHAATFATSATIGIAAQIASMRPDVVATVCPTIACAPLAIAVAALTGAQTWLHIQDLEIEAAIELGMLKRQRLQKMLLQAELALLRRFDRVSTISSSMKRRIEARSPELRSPIDIFPNWINPEHIFPISGNSPLRARFGVQPGDRLVLYSGSLVAKQGLETIIEVARSLRSRGDIIFAICGDGPVKSSLIEAASGLKNVRFLPLQPRGDLNDLLGAADIHLLPQRPGVSDLVMPSKLGPMLASGRCVVATANRDSEIALAVGDGGIIVPQGDIRELSDAIRKLSDDSELRHRLGTAARARVVKELGCESIFERIDTMLHSLNNGHYSPSTPRRS